MEMSFAFQLWSVVCGSHIKAAAKRVTRSMTLQQNEPEQEPPSNDDDKWNNMLTNAKRHFKNTT